MKGSDELTALITRVDGDERLELELGEALGRFHARRDRQIRDMEAARLLPLGADVVASRQHCHRSTAYRRAGRVKIVALISAGATCKA